MTLLEKPYSVEAGSWESEMHMSRFPRKVPECGVIRTLVENLQVDPEMSTRQLDEALRRSDDFRRK